MSRALRQDREPWLCAAIRVNECPGEGLENEFGARRADPQRQNSFRGDKGKVNRQCISKTSSASRCELTTIQECLLGASVLGMASCCGRRPAHPGGDGVRRAWRLPHCARRHTPSRFPPLPRTGSLLHLQQGRRGGSPARARSLRNACEQPSTAPARAASGWLGQSSHPGVSTGGATRQRQWVSYLTEPVGAGSVVQGPLDSSWQRAWQGGCGGRAGGATWTRLQHAGQAEVCAFMKSVSACTDGVG